MELTIPIIIQVLMFAGSLIGVYVNLNNKIIKLEADGEANRHSINKIDSKSDKIAEELKEIKDLIIEMKIELAIQKEKNSNEKK